MTDALDPGLLEFLGRYVTPHRLETMERVLAERTRYLAVVVEDVYQPHNASAVLRTCDALGVQDVHVIENRNAWRPNPGVELGSAKWLTLRRYRGGADNTPEAVGALRAAGYRIVATSPRPGHTTPAAFDLCAGPAALLFGNELEGLSRTALDSADEFLAVPMHGFVESLNLSVSVAVVLSRLTERLRAGGVGWRMTERERSVLLLEWLRRSVGRAGALEREYRARRAAEGRP